MWGRREEAPFEQVGAGFRRRCGPAVKERKKEEKVCSAFETRRGRKLLLCRLLCSVSEARCLAPPGESRPPAPCSRRLTAVLPPSARGCWRSSRLLGRLSCSQEDKRKRVLTVTPRSNRQTDSIGLASNVSQCSCGFIVLNSKSLSVRSQLNLAFVNYGCKYGCK